MKNVVSRAISCLQRRPFIPKADHPDNEAAFIIARYLQGVDIPLEEADTLLWHCTAFPCIDIEELETQLTQVKLDSGGNFALAMKQADEVMRRACETK